jgi:hypothetical protein
MIHLRETTKPFDAAVRDLEVAAKARRVCIMKAYDVKRTLWDRGFEIADERHVLEICAPRGIAPAEPAADPERCQICVYGIRGRTLVWALAHGAPFEAAGRPSTFRAAPREIEAAAREIVDTVADAPPLPPGARRPAKLAARGANG